jgi:hypothetical protein
MNTTEVTAVTRMIAPTTFPQLTAALSNIMARAINGEISEAQARVALNAASRMVETIQAETRIRALALLSKQTLPQALPLDVPIWPPSPS